MRDDPSMPAVFFFGAMSPYSWFAAERIGSLLPHAKWQPVFAGGVFKANRRVSWGLTQERAVKLADCNARARVHGLGPIRWPDPWPTNDLLIARAMIFVQQRGAVKQFALTAMRMAFVEGLDLGEVDVVSAVADRSGFAGGEVTRAVGDAEVKATLRATTDAVVALGVFGVPTVRVDDALFWGDDRLHEAAALANRAPTPPAT